MLVKDAVAQITSILKHPELQRTWSSKTLVFVVGDADASPAVCSVLHAYPVNVEVDF
jgi:hypothetical protein